MTHFPDNATVHHNADGSIARIERGRVVSGWFVFDPSPDEGEGPKLLGPFPDEVAASEYANLIHPDDESGDTIVLPATAP